VRPDPVPAGQAWLVGVRGDTRRSRLYAMTARGLFVSASRGVSWRRLGAGGQFLGFDATRPGHLLAVSRHGGSVVSLDAGRSWRQASPAGCMTDLDGALLSRDGGLVYGWVGGPVTADDPHRAAVVVSHDGGRSFAKIASYETESIAVADDPRRTYLTTASGLFVSRDSGTDWRRAGGLPEDLHAAAVAPTASSTVFVVADTGRFVQSQEGEGGTTQRLYRSLDAGEHAKSVLEMFDITSISFAPGRPTTVYVAGEQIIDDHARIVVLRSRDLGSHWQTRSSAPSVSSASADYLETPMSPNADSLAVDPTDPGIVYRDLGGQIERSLDGGRRFHRLRVRSG
jgi:hypothetical protein